MDYNSFKKKDGFTLIEIIITLVVVAILASMIFQFTYTSAKNSTQASIWFAREVDLQEAMEKIVAIYRIRVETDMVDLQALRDDVDTVVANANNDTEVDTDQTGYIDFVPDGSKKFKSSSITSSYGSQIALIVTLKNNGQRLQSLFTK